MNLLVYIADVSYDEFFKLIMPKTPRGKRNAAAHNSASSHAGKGSAANHIFKMKTDIGQHVLKNPGVAQAIVDKADLKQSDVRLLIIRGTSYALTIFR